MNATPSKSAASRRRPGWGMTQDQISLFWRLWSGACAYQGWDAMSSADRDEKRHEVLAECGFASAKHIDRTDGFDRVKKHLLELQGRVHNESEDAGERRRIVSRLGIILAEMGEAGYPEHSLNTILRERFKIIEGVNTITDLETRELLNLVRTLSSRLASWKRCATVQTEPGSTGTLPEVGAFAA
ncbi:MAG TPA: hypothetical protein VH619_17055 [Verrucomicrobiae bacterium]|jgi:hypothetical protein|nr:hypothetical protein [Verrucomicrobiae bacterium]